MIFWSFYSISSLSYLCPETYFSVWNACLICSSVKKMKSILNYFKPLVFQSVFHSSWVCDSFTNRKNLLLLKKTMCLFSKMTREARRGRLPHRYNKYGLLNPWIGFRLLAWSIFKKSKSSQGQRHLVPIVSQIFWFRHF